MASYSVVPLNKLIEQFERLPGVGRKSARRLAFYVLSLGDEEVNELINTIKTAHDKIKRCNICQTFSDTELCNVCEDTSRDKTTICVVETPRDVMAFERTHEYRGVYHVLHGLISPVDGIGPEELTIAPLLSRLGEVGEVIMATNPTVEGEATAMYIARLIKPLNIRVTRLALGIPVGGNLEYADEVTLYRALEGRRTI